MPRLNCRDHGAAVPPAWERRQGRRDETISLWYHFSSLADRKLPDFMVGHLQETSKLFSFPAPWLVHSSYCLQPAQDPAGAHFSSESDHWQIATLDISAATTPELCTVTARREHRNCAGHNWSWAVHYYSVAPLLALSLSAFPAALPPGLTTTVVRKKKKKRTITKKKKPHSKVLRKPKTSIYRYVTPILRQHSEESPRNCPQKSELFNIDTPNPWDCSLLGNTGAFMKPQQGCRCCDYHQKWC